MTLNDILQILKNLEHEDLPGEVLKTTGSTFHDETYDKIEELVSAHGGEFHLWPKQVRDELLKIKPLTMPKPRGDKLYLWPDGEYRDQPPKTNMLRTHYEDLTKEDREWLRQTYLFGCYIPDRDKLTEEEIKAHPDYSEVAYEQKMERIMSHFTIKRRTVQYWVKYEGLVRQALQLKAKEIDLVAAGSRELKPGVKYLLITAAQNASRVHEEGWRNLLAYYDFLGAEQTEILVIPYRYKNPTSVNPDLPNEYWSPKVVPFLDLARHDVSETLSILSDVKVQPTAAHPLQGIHELSGPASCIVGHSKMHLTSIPILEGQHPKIAYTTGAITQANYTDTKAGKKGNFHHVLGFIIVEIDEDCEHVRHVPMCDDGSFIDLVHSVNDGKVSRIEECVALRMGDLHVGDHDPEKIKATVKLANTLVPEYVILDDVFNGHSVNPHEAKDGIIRYQNIQRGRSSLRTEIDEMLDFLGWFKEEVFRSDLVVVRSNHDDFLDRYIRSNDWGRDITNALEFSEGLTTLLKGEAPKGLIPYYINEKFPDIKCLGLDESFIPGDIEHGHHGHLGSNGSRGSISQYSNLSTKVMVAHGHHPERLNGAIMVGTSTFLRVGYNQGASNWRQGDGIEHVNGKAQLVIFTNHKFTTFL